MSFDGKKFAREYMGNPVEISSYLSRYTDTEGRRAWRMLSIEPRHGWVVGARWVQTEKVLWGYIDEPNTFMETGPRQLVYLVTPWPLMKPYKVHPEHVKLLGPDDDFFPSFHDVTARELMAQWMIDTPRDEKGRWLKEEEG